MWDSGRASSYNTAMELPLDRELEAKLARAAAEAGKEPGELVQELVTDYLAHDEWFRAEVAKGLASLDAGKHVSHEAVRDRINKLLGSR